ncbi:MAG: S-methyl-5-thioribose-1-phosphate isomerase [Ilumatobacteraceae bacterium]
MSDKSHGGRVVHHTVVHHTVAWIDGAVEMIDQTRLPQDEVTLRCTTVDEVIGAIQRLAVRGAPAIGVAGAYGVALAATVNDPVRERAAFDHDVARLRAARPTAVNLARMVDRVAAATTSAATALAEADAVRDDEREASYAMGERGADLLLRLCGHRPLRVMTICNTGGLATVERGTALAVIQTLHERDLLAEALPLETRPLLQGGRLTAWELQRMGAPFRLLVDSAAASLLARGFADAVVAGADRIAASGDTANKVGTFALALAARHAGVPFVIVAPESTVDMATPDGAHIEIEDRSTDEVVSIRGMALCPPGTVALNPAFDVTPVGLIDALVTDRRVVNFREGEALR